MNRASLPALRLKDISERLGGSLIGDPELIIRGVAEPSRAAPDQIIALSDKRRLSEVEASRAGAVVSELERGFEGKSAVRIPNARLALAVLLGFFYRNKHPQPGIHPSAIIGRDVRLGRDVAVHAGVVLDDGVEVGDRTVLYPQVYVGRNCRVGSECVFYSNVSIYHDVEIGNRVIIHSGSVLGSDGYGYARREDGGHEKMPHTGRVVVEDDVEIGALSAVDRATLEETRIGQGTKIDNLVQVAHNVKIGENCLLLGQAGMAGSSSLGQGVTVAARSGVGDHVHIGDRAILTALTAVNRDVQPDSLWAAARIPRPFVEHMKLEISLGKVPQALKTLDDLEKRLTDLEGKITGEFHDQAED